MLAVDLQESCRWGGKGGEGRGQSTWKHANTLQGCILGRERTCDNGGVNQWSTWKGSMKTLQGLPLTMLILLGGLIDGQLGKDLQRHCKDYL